MRIIRADQIILGDEHGDHLRLSPDEISLWCGSRPLLTLGTWLRPGLNIFTKGQHADQDYAALRLGLRANGHPALALVNAHNREILWIGVDDVGVPAVQLLDPNGSGAAVEVCMDEHGRPQVHLLDTHGRCRVEARVDHESGGTPSVSLCDEDNVTRVELLAASDTPTIHLFDREGHEVPQPPPSLTEENNPEKQPQGTRTSPGQRCDVAESAGQDEP